jgi:Fe-S-cluster-containing dehydrogenase component
MKGTLRTGYGFFVDPSRCLGCRTCVAACSECDSHKGVSMIHVDYLDRRNSVATAPTVCVHCDEPTCVAGVPGRRRQARRGQRRRNALEPRCIGCSNCVLAAVWRAEGPCRARADDEVRQVMSLPIQHVATLMTQASPYYPRPFKILIAM